MKYAAAVAYCDLLGAILFTPRNDDENQWGMATRGWVWLGYRRDSDTDPFVGEDGLGGLNYTNWNDFEPNKHYNCGEFMASKGKWETFDCDKASGILCQLRDCFRPDCPDAEQPDE